ncbi:MAG TPA: flagellar export chaperone FliS [Verrucomicrobiae bacterium]|jgi:flagellar protein FliS|nr:flagellar export chaperone FliS [Verrucomicrobiae bacterium]
MNNFNPLKSYTQIAAQTASPGLLVLMLFDRALRSLHTSLAGFEYTDPRQRNETIHNNLRHAVDIIRLLNNSLDLEQGGELAGTLRNLYRYFEDRLLKSNLQKRRDGVDEVIMHLKPLRDSWAEILSKQAQEPQEVQLLANLA